MSRWICLTLLIARGALAQGTPAGSRADSLVDKQTVVAAERRFLVAWDSLWKNSQQFSGSFTFLGDVVGVMSPRLHNLHCHPDFSGQRSAMGEGRLLRSANTWFSVCPSWDLADGPPRVNERLSIDTALVANDRVLARRLRGELLRTLDSASRAAPQDDFYAGQRVRFLLDQHDLDGAARVARDCASTAWWCHALDGLVRATRGDVLAADSAFDAAFAAMPTDERCRWTDYRALIDVDERKPYVRASCVERDALNDKLWWLSDPLLIVPGNERRVEQHARIMWLALRANTDLDERYQWDPAIGNDARREMLVRYGWPSFAAWGGPRNDSSHTRYLSLHQAPRNEPYTTYEYAGARTHLVPAWSAIANPTHAVPSDWDMSAPDPREAPPRPPKPVATTVTGLYTPSTRSGDNATPAFWWPVEHFEPTTPIAQLPDGQQALLRRKNGALLSVATELGTFRLGRRNGDSISSVVLVTSEAPGSVRRVSESIGIVGQPFQIQGLISSHSGIAGVEFLPSRGVQYGARLRFGIAPAPPLTAMRTGEFAVSDPVILRAPTSAAPLPNEPNAALRLMATSRTVANTDQIGVFWETYGLAPTDSVEIAVWIERYTPQGVARRFGIALRIATDLNTPVSVGWSEPQPGHSAHVFSEGTVPVVARAVTLNISSLVTGDYRLEIAVRKPGQDPVRGRTTFVVQR